MRELSVKEMEETGGGLWPVVAAIFVVYGEDIIDSFAEGFLGQPQS